VLSTLSLHDALPIYAAVGELFHHPLHPYTVGLLNSVPVFGKKSGQVLVPIKGMVPPATLQVTGCAFAPRCPHAMPICWEQQPPRSEEHTSELQSREK